MGKPENAREKNEKHENATKSEWEMRKMNRIEKIRVKVARKESRST